MNNTKNQQVRIIGGLFLVALTANACSKSSMQPTITDKTYKAPVPPPVVVPVVVQPEPPPPVIPPPPKVVTCTRTKGHKVYYASSSIDLTYTCDDTIATYALTGAPSFLTATA